MILNKGGWKMIGDKIILYRKRKGLTQEELADLLEVSRQTVTKWESGSVLPNLDYIMGLSVIFGITIDNLVKDNDCAKQEIESKISNYNWIDFMLKAKKQPMLKRRGKLFPVDLTAMIINIKKMNIYILIRL